MYGVVMFYSLGVLLAIAILTDLLFDKYCNLRYSKSRSIELYITCLLSWLAVIDLIIFYNKYEKDGFY